MDESVGKPKKRKEIAEEEKPKRFKPRRAPGKTIESRENQIISLAYDEAERRIKKHTASSQEITHFLKQGSILAQLEKVKLENENLLLKAKTESLESQKKVEELYAKAIKAFKTYNGQETDDGDD